MSVLAIPKPILLRSSALSSTLAAHALPSCSCGRAFCGGHKPWSRRLEPIEYDRTFERLMGDNGVIYVTEIMRRGTERRNWGWAP